jgi:RHS repeat-associated protein
MAYQDFDSLWVLGRPTTTTEISTGSVIQSNTYDNNANLSTTSHFGVLKSAYTYSPDGTLKTVTDGAGAAHQVVLDSFKRGIPQTITYPTGHVKSAVVSDIGKITSLTNEAGSTTTYDYDAMGRLKLIVYPVDSPAYSNTTVSFAKMAASELGLPAGFWKQTLVTGKLVERNYFDALWRPVITERYDVNNRAGTGRFTVRGFNIDGKTTYESYPSNAISSYLDRPAGTFNDYDALQRVWRSTQDSELGGLVTSTNYLPGFQTRVTDPRGNATTSSFQAFDDPGAAVPVAIASPENVNTVISRNIFGEPYSLTRSGSYSGGTVSATRSFVYDSGHRLCKTVEPETGATVIDFDAAGNIAWQAKGQNLPATNDCSRTAVAGSAKASMGYDARNRLLSVTYGDGVTPAIGRSWTPDGLPETISRGGNANTWTYSYNNRRLLTKESLSFYGNTSFDFKRGYNNLGDLTAITYPDGSAPSLAPNAFGEQSSMGTHVTGVARYANGAVGAYTMLNGATHSVGMNARYLPYSLVDAFPGGEVLVSDTYTYDAAGNVLSITDGARAGKTTRVMTYDGRDRLKAVASSQQWGSASYVYDPLDNLRQSTLATRVTNLDYDANNRLGSLSIAGTPFTVNHDAAGRLTQRGAFGYSWDQDDRLTGVSGAANEFYEYDGLGHRVRVLKPDGSQLVQMYTSDNQLRLGQKITPAGAVTNTKYFYLDDKLVAEANGATMTYMHTDALGSPVARTLINKTVSARTQYEPYGDLFDGTDPVGIGYAGHVNDLSTGLSYQQQRYYDPLLGRFITADPVVSDMNSGGNFNRYWYANNSPYRYRDPDGRDTYLVNRDLQVAGNSAASRWNPITHTFVVTTNSDGTITHAYSWGNEANLKGWSKDQPLDLKTAKEALEKDKAEKVGDSKLDKQIDKAFDGLNKKENEHVNKILYDSCKTEAAKLIAKAKSDMPKQMPEVEKPKSQ